MVGEKKVRKQTKYAHKLTTTSIVPFFGESLGV